MLKRWLITLVVLSGSLLVSASQISFKNIDKIKVDEMSDTEVADFVDKYKKSGYTLADVERIAKTKNVSAAELEKLKYRINSLESSSNSNVQTTNDLNLSQSSGGTSKITSVQVSSESEKSMVFGASMFRSMKSSFEPSQSMATPRNYTIGATDALHVDVYGLSEATFDLTVSAEGTVRIPNVGLVQVSGLTIEQAENIIKKKLSSIYSTLSTGRTSLSLTVNKIRSIKVYVIGEVENPGSYVLSSVSSVFNAMGACGGPSKNGSMRNVKLVRGGKEIATIDLYEFLVNGIMPSDVSLQDQDVINVPPYENRVAVNGFVKREGLYELKSGETLKQLIDYCGGFTDDAYTDRISVTRNLNGEKSVADVTKELFSMFTPASGDVYQVDKILEKYSNRVQILGSVFRPGVYALDNGMTLRDLVSKANGLTEDAFMQSATLVRLKEDLTPEIVSFNVKDLMDGRFNVSLQKEDIVTIGAQNEFESDKKIGIYGSVNSPGVFPYYENVTLKDLIFLARGFREDADPAKIEVVRRITDENVLASDNEKIQIFNFSLDRELVGADGDFKLEPKDQVTVRSLEGYEVLGTVRVLGEVRHPGTYSIIKKTEKISDVMARSGGISQYAYEEGAFLIRSSNRTEAEKRRDQKLLEMLKEADGVMSVEEIKKELESRQDLVGIQLKRILRWPGSETDLNLEDGDIIFVPKTMQTITVSGSVQVPGMEVYTGSSTRKYIRGAGGFDKKARKSGLYVAYPNGSIASTKHFLWWRNYPEVKPGSHIFIPEKEDKSEDNRTRAQILVPLFASVVSMFATVTATISTISKK